MPIKRKKSSNSPIAETSKNLASDLKEIYEAFLRAGFDTTQAFELTKIVLLQK